MKLLYKRKVLNLCLQSYLDSSRDLASHISNENTITSKEDYKSEKVYTTVKYGKILKQEWSLQISMNPFNATKATKYCQAKYDLGIKTYIFIPRSYLAWQ